MKNFIIIFIVLIVAGCNSSKSIMNTLEQSEFSETEKQDIIKLIDFFESKIAVEGKSKSESYEIFLNDAFNNYEAVPNKIPIEEQRDLINSLNLSTRNELWIDADSRVFKLYNGDKLNEPLHYKSIAIVVNGKYSKLLENIGETNPKVKDYVSNVIKIGDLPMYYQLYNLFYHNNEVKLVEIDKNCWRLIISIHFLISNEEQNRYMSLRIK